MHGWKWWERPKQARGEWLFPEAADNINISLDGATSAPYQWIDGRCVTEWRKSDRQERSGGRRFNQVIPYQGRNVIIRLFCLPPHCVNVSYLLQWTQIANRGKPGRRLAGTKGKGQGASWEIDRWFWSGPGPAKHLEKETAELDPKSEHSHEPREKKKHL